MAWISCGPATGTRKNAGYFWGVDDSNVTNSGKLAYGHAFVLLAAASAKSVGHPNADRLLNEVSEVLLSRFLGI